VTHLKVTRLRLPDAGGDRGVQEGFHPISRLIALIGLAISGPLLVVAALLIKVSSRGPVLFRASRAGRLGRPFTILKLRTMHQHSSAGSAITGGDDDRIFAVGRILRKLKIDELPQLINVLRGEMTIIGPRPEEPNIVREHYTPMMRRTLDVLPGLASPGSLQYYADGRILPGDSTDAERMYVSEMLLPKLALELVYVANRSFWYDVQLTLRTAAAIFGFWNVFPRSQQWERHEAIRLLRSQLGSTAIEIAE